jgi:macrolide-specific efflux system membrane fusion protein
MSADVSVALPPLGVTRKKRGRWVAAGAILVLLIVVAIVGWQLTSRGSAPSTSSLATATAVRRTITVTVSGTGSSVAANSITVNPQISGTVEKLGVSLGETVTAGQTLYTISGSDVETALLKAKASLLQSEQSLTQARSSYRQAESQLYSANTQVIQARQSVDNLESEPTTAPSHAYNLKVAKRQLSSAKAGVSSAELGVTSAELGIESAEANLTTAKESYTSAKDDASQTEVTAPSGGVITALPISVGSAVSAGTNSSSSSGSSAGGSSTGSAGSSSSGSSSSSSGSGSSITITDMSSMQVELTVSEVDIPKVAVGQKASITFDAISGKTFTGVVKSIMPNATTSSGVVNYTVYVKLDSLDPRLRTGMTASVDVQTQVASDVVAVPSAAVKTGSGTKYVVVVDPASGQTRTTPVSVGVSDDTYTQILSGVSAGTVVSTGSASNSSSSSGSSSGTSSSNSRSGGAFMMGAGGPPSGGPGGN